MDGALEFALQTGSGISAHVHWCGSFLRCRSMTAYSEQHVTGTEFAFILFLKYIRSASDALYQEYLYSND